MEPEQATAAEPRRERNLMLLQQSTWQEVDSYLEKSTGIIIPIGSTEQHGPIGLIGTDAICPEGIAKGVGEAENVLVAPTFNVGMAQHHMAFAGSMTLRPTTMIAVIKDWIASLAKHGFDHFYFLNGHGGNMTTVSAAFSEIYADRSLGDASNAPLIKMTLKNWWMYPSVSKLRKEIYGAKEGAHATPSEIALTQYLCGDAIKTSATKLPAAPNGTFRDAEDYRQKFPDGRIGAASEMANPKDGEKLYKAAVKDIARDYKDFLTS